MAILSTHPRVPSDEGQDGVTRYYLDKLMKLFSFTLICEFRLYETRHWRGVRLPWCSPIGLQAEWKGQCLYPFDFLLSSIFADTTYGNQRLARSSGTTKIQFWIIHRIYPRFCTEPEASGIEQIFVLCWSRSAVSVMVIHPLAVPVGGRKWQEILKLDRVMARTGMGRTSIYLDPDLTRIKIGPKSVGWLSSEVDAWIERRLLEARDARRVKNRADLQIKAAREALKVARQARGKEKVASPPPQSEAPGADLPEAA